MAQLASVAASAQHRPVYGYGTADAGPDGEQHHVMCLGRGAQLQLCHERHVGVVVEDHGPVDGRTDVLAEAQPCEVHVAG